MPSLPITPRYHPLPPRPPALVPKDLTALYLHVPFCSTKCHYCDFYSIAGHLDQTADFLRALDTEAALQTAHFTNPAPQTIFIGGGTPTLLAPPHLKEVLTILHRHITTENLTEFTVEANPNTFDAEKAHILAAAGVNRLSFGAQSFHPSELATLQRDHNPDSVAPALAAARSVGITNLNIDLIFGIPGQTLASWSTSLHRALDLSPTHLSCYSLIYEPNTAMTARLTKKEFAPIDEDLELDMFNLTYDTLRSAGFIRYEVSNYSLPGKPCQHNINYWTGQNYLAWGPAASAHIAGHRTKNAPSLNRYLEALLPPKSKISEVKSSEEKTYHSELLNFAPRSPLVDHELLPPHKRAGELATLLLRLTDGIDIQSFESKTQIPLLPTLANVLKKYEGLNFLDLTPTHLRLTEPAVRVSNTILADVLAAFDRQ